MMMNEVKESKPDVGQSKMITCGSLISSKPIEVLFLQPPEIPFMNFPPTITSKQLQSFSCLLSLSIFQSFSPLEQSSLRLAAKVRVQRTVRVDISTSVCITQLAKFPKSSQLQVLLLAQSWPRPYPRPILHAITLSKEVLPAPEDPIIAVTRPLLQIPETLSRIVLRLYFLVKGRLSPLVLYQTSTPQLMFWKQMSIPFGGLLRRVSVFKIYISYY